VALGLLWDKGRFGKELGTGKGYLKVFLPSDEDWCWLTIGNAPNTDDRYILGDTLFDRGLGIEIGLVLRCK